MAQHVSSIEQPAPGSTENAVVSDENLMAEVIEGDKTAFTQLYDRHVPTVYALCLKIMRKESDAEAVVSDVFLEIWRKPSYFDASRGSFRTYLLTLARSRAIDRWRATATRVRKTQEASIVLECRSRPFEEFEPSHVVQTSERRHAVRAAIEELDEAQRETLRLAYFEGLTHREISERLNLPLGTVKTRIRHGLKKLRISLSSIGESGGLS